MYRRAWLNRIWENGMNRSRKIEIIKKHIDFDGVGLELGPNVNPMFRKSHGYNVKYLESRGTQELREWMKSRNRNPSLVEEIDFILARNMDLSGNVSGESFRWVASSHVLEHIPDFVSHLNEVYSVLEEGGVYAAIIPDRNFCFDCNKPKSSLGDVVEAYIEKRKIPRIASNIDEFRYGARPQGVTMGGWTAEQAQNPLIPKYPNWQDLVKRIIHDEERKESVWAGHSWRFDPITFSEIIMDLSYLELVDLHLFQIIPTYNMDFIALFKKEPNPDPSRLKSLVEQMYDTYRHPEYVRV